MSDDTPQDPPMTEEELKKALSELTDEQRQRFGLAMDIIRTRHRIMFWGNILGLFTAVIGALIAVVVYSNREEGQFIGWVLLLPFAFLGITIYFFGRWSRNYGSHLIKQHESETDGTDKPQD